MTSKTIAAIDAQAPCLTLINVYEVEPKMQADLAKALSETVQNSIGRQPGFISVCVHSSLDGSKVVNYAQWASKEYLDSFMTKPEA
jgi:hypothetical protein